MCVTGEENKLIKLSSLDFSVGPLQHGLAVFCIMTSAGMSASTSGIGW